MKMTFFVIIFLPFTDYFEGPNPSASDSLAQTDRRCSLSDSITLGLTRKPDSVETPHKC